MIVKVALRNGYNVYGRVVEENSSSIRLVAQRELIPEMRIAHIRCSKDIGETIVIDRSQVVETEEVSYMMKWSLLVNLRQNGLSG